MCEALDPMQPLVSILIPAFDAQQWIAETIQSALGQTWPRKEIIVVDDGSTDQTLAIARRSASKNVSIIAQENQGAAAARNKAFAICQGDYIQWLDADDLLAPDKIARQVESLNRGTTQRTLLSAGWARFMYRPHKARFVPTTLWCDLSPLEWLLRKWEHHTYMQTGSWLVSRQLTEAVGPWDTRVQFDDDGEYFCRVIVKSDGIRFVQDAKVFYRRSGLTSLSHNRNLEAHLLSMQLQVRHLRSLEDSKRVRAACLKYLQSSLIYFYPERLDIVTQVEQLAKDLGGKLEVPRLRWKYAWLRPILGYHFAKRAQLYLPRVKETFKIAWDKALFQLENRKLARGDREQRR